MIHKMKIRTPQYYSKFKCIAGACTDTCCAGWDVDVDADSYKYYKTVKGQFGKRLKSVMVPSDDGGCTFTLNNGRCPFLNNRNLCDLYTELGEDRLCDTCAEFPRFINEYGSVREIGIAPSCITAGEIIFNYKDKLEFVVNEDDKPVSMYNDIDPMLYMGLITARNTAYKIAQDRDLKIEDRLMLLLDFSKKLQIKIDNDRTDLIVGISKRYKSGEYIKRRLISLYKAYSDENNYAAYNAVFKYFDEFTGMEVINSEWLKYCDIIKKFKAGLDNRGKADDMTDITREFNKYYKDRQFEYEQIIVYYIYRYFLDAVNDYDVLLKMKNAVVGFAILKCADIVVWNENGGELSKKEQINIAHLYSRQFEHSYTNFSKYSEMFESRRIYSFTNMMKILQLTQI